jgi:hypothetical protein
MSYAINFRCRVALGVVLVLALGLPATPSLGAAIEPPGRVVAIGDIHGEYDGLVGILRESKLIDEDNQWIGGDAVLVQTGDYLDRGPKVRMVLDLLMDLEKQAPTHGGQAIILMGNHESMNLLADFRDVTDEICASFATEESDQLREKAYKEWVKWMRQLARTRGQTAPQLNKDKKEAWMAEHPPGYIEYLRAMGPEGEYGQWIAARPVMVKVGDTLYMHAGISPKYATATIDEINQLHWDETRVYQEDREALAKARIAPRFFNLMEVNSALYYQTNNPPLERFANPVAQQLVKSAADNMNKIQNILVEESPLWYRGYTKLDDADLEEHMTRLEENFGVSHFVVAHSPMVTGKIHERLGGTVFLIDTGMLTSYYKGRASALEFDKGLISAIYENDRVVLLDSREDVMPASASADNSAWRQKLRPMPAVLVSSRVERVLPAAYPLQDDSASSAGEPKRVFVDVDNKPLPFQTPTEVEQFLRESKMVAKEKIPIGITKPMKITLENNGVKIYAKFSSVDQAGQNEKLADGSTEMYFLDSYKSDLAAYELSKLLGMNSVPPAIERQIDRTDGIVQIWIEDLTSYKTWLEEGNTGQPSSVYLKRQVKDMRTFDLLIRNSDRHQANIMWDPKDNLWLIDHTRSLARNAEIRKGEDFEGCSRDLYNAIKGLDAKEVKKQLKPFLGTFEINALMKRRDKLVKLIDKEIGKKGEDKVLFNYGDPPPGMVIKQSPTASLDFRPDPIAVR